MGPAGRTASWWSAIPASVVATVAVVIVGGLLAGGAYLFYRALDPLYPQDLWRYFRPAAVPRGGSVLFRDLDGQLFLAPAASVSPAGATRLMDPAAGGREIVRDAVMLAGGNRIAYIATERREGQPDQDRVKVVDRAGTVSVDVAAPEAEPVRPALSASADGRFLALTNRDRSSVYYLDTIAGAGASFTRGRADAPPQEMLWNRNADLRTPATPNTGPYASSPDGKLRVHVRSGTRRAPECDTARCESAQEIVVTSGTPAGAQRPATVLFGAFSAFSADGWGPIPTQPAMRFFGRLVWAPDGSAVLFNALDGAVTSMYAVGSDGRSQPRLLLEGAEALDWIS